MSPYFLMLSTLNQNVSSSKATNHQGTNNNSNIFQEIDGQQQQKPKHLR
jgi:hypothetical protein